jgi:hypothetical protein
MKMQAIQGFMYTARLRGRFRWVVRSRDMTLNNGTMLAAEEYSGLSNQQSETIQQSSAL